MLFVCCVSVTAGWLPGCFAGLVAGALVGWLVTGLVA